VFSSSGLYGALHIPTAQFMSAAGIKMRHLPTNGGGPALTAFLGNNAQVLASSISASLAQIKAGKARPLAMFGDKRSAALPDVPTMKELGYDVEYYLWVGLFAPKGTPTDIVNKVREAAKKGAHTDVFKKAMSNLGQELDYMDQPEFAKFWAADAAKIEAAVKAIGKQA
jgi:tripartite-type tricarboxylate transporter receptor subunit TctC